MVPLFIYRVIEELISATTTKTGLTVRCELDTGRDSGGVVMSAPGSPSSASNAPSCTASGTKPSRRIRLRPNAPLFLDEPLACARDRASRESTFRLTASYEPTREDTGGRLKVGCDRVENGTEVGADGSHDDHCGNRDQRRDQAIFDRGNPASVLHQAAQGRAPPRFLLDQAPQA